MSIIVWLVTGGLVGWVASQVLRTDGRLGLLINCAAGFAGAALGGTFLGPLFGVSTHQNDFSPNGMTGALAGAAIFLVIVNFIRRGAVRNG